MLQSLVVYILMALWMIGFGIIAARRELLFNHRAIGTGKHLSFIHFDTIFPILIFAVIFGCRYNVGVDYPTYLEIYLHGFDANFYGNDREFEFLFGWATENMSRMGIHYSFYFALWAFIQSFLLFYTFRNQRFLFPYIAFFLIFGSYYLSMMNIIRQQLAACIFIYSIQFINNKQFFRFVLTIFIASLFHKSAWLTLVTYPIFQWKKDWFSSIKWQFFLLAIAAYLSKNYDLVVQLISQPFAFLTGAAGYENYLVGILYNERLNSISQFGNNTGLGFIINIFLSSVIIGYSKKMKEFYNGNFFLIIYSLWFVRILADFIVGESIILNRPFVYVYNLKIIILAYFVYYCFKTKKTITQVLGVSFFIIHIALFLNIISNGEVNTAMFQFFWQK